MKVMNVTQAQLDKALETINKKYKGNVIWNRFDVGNQKHTTFNLTLRVTSSKGLGARLGPYPYGGGNRRHLVAACWHVHGDFFDTVLKINPDAVIRVATHKIDINGGNWIDRNIGSQVMLMMYSDACECYENGLI